MTSILTAAMSDALRNNAPRCLFVRIENIGSTGYFCTGIRSRTWDGQTWSPVGHLGKITPMKHTSEIAIQDIVFSLSGVEADILSTLNDDVRNLSGQVWLACLDASDMVISEPYQLVDSLLDKQSFTIEDDGTTLIEIVAHSGFYTLSRAIDEAWTPENQKALFSTDTGLDLIPALQNQDLQWTAS